MNMIKRIFYYKLNNKSFNNYDSVDNVNSYSIYGKVGIVSEDSAYQHLANSKTFLVNPEYDEILENFIENYYTFD